MATVSTTPPPDRLPSQAHACGTSHISQHTPPCSPHRPPAFPAHLQPGRASPALPEDSSQWPNPPATHSMRNRPTLPRSPETEGPGAGGRNSTAGGAQAAGHQPRGGTPGLEPQTQVLSRLPRLSRVPRVGPPLPARSEGMGTSLRGSIGTAHTYSLNSPRHVCETVEGRLHWDPRRWCPAVKCGQARALQGLGHTHLWPSSWGT